MKYFWIVCCLILAPRGIITAQESSISKPLKFGMGLLAITYQGELVADASLFQRFNPGVNFSMEVASPSRFHIQLNAGTGSFTEQLVQPITSSDNSFIETSFVYTDLQFRLRLLKYSRFQPFIGVGGGILFFTPRDAEGELVDIDVPAENPTLMWNQLVPQLPLRAGMELWITDRFAINMDYTYRIALSDVLDNRIDESINSRMDVIHQFQIGAQFSIAPSPQWKAKHRAKQNHSREAEDTLDGYKDSIIYAPDSLLPLQAKLQEAKSGKDSLHNQPNFDPFVYYRLKQEESLDSLALRFNVDTLALIKANPKWKKALIPGMLISIPIRDSIHRNELMSLSDIIVDEIIMKDIFQERVIQGILLSNAEIISPEGQFIYYRVEEGENLEEIAARFELRIGILRELNYLDSFEVAEGLLLKIPNLWRGI